MSAPAEHGPSEGRANPAGKVGYGKPPEEHRFRKGVSGNPKGRPKKMPTAGEDSPSELYEATAAELGRTLRVTENGKVRKMSVTQAVLRNLVNQALKGDREASRILLHQQRMLDQDRRRDRQRRFDRQVDYKRRSAETLHRCDLEGYEPPAFLPHPADMQIDSKRQRVIITGPADDVEKAEWDAAEADRQDMIKSIAELTTVLTGPEKGLKPYKGSRAFVLKLLDETKEALAALDATYPSEKQRRRPGYTPCHNQKAKDRAPPVIRPTPDVGSAASVGRGTEPEKTQSVERNAGTPPDLAALFGRHSFSQSIQVDRPASASRADRDVSKAERDKIAAERQELTTRISYLDKQLSVSEEDLDPQFETHLDAAFLHKEITEKLYQLDDLYPDAEQWQRSATKVKRRKQKATGSDPPMLH